MTLSGTIWIVLGLTTGLLTGASLPGLIGIRRRRAVRAFAATVFTSQESSEPHQVSATPTTDEAELQLRLIYKRLRAYLQNSYDFDRSRIRDEAGFQNCLDLAVSLNIRICHLSGAEIPGGEQAREQIRQRILGGLAKRPVVAAERASAPDRAPFGLAEAQASGWRSA